MSDADGVPSAVDRITVVDDDPAEAAALSVALTAAGFDAAPGTADRIPDSTMVVLVRRNRIDPSEIETLSRGITLIAAGPPDVEAMLMAVEHGALAYVEAGAPYTDFAVAIEGANRGEASVPPRMLGGLLQRVIEQQREQRLVAEQLDVLSPREMQVFELVVQGADKHVLAEQLFISPETARTHIQNVMNKLGANSRVELVGLAAAAGLPTTPTEGVSG